MVFFDLFDLFGLPDFFDRPELRGMRSPDAACVAPTMARRIERCTKNFRREVCAFCCAGS
jgi:hypothetical protein